MRRGKLKKWRLENGECENGKWEIVMKNGEWKKEN